MASKGHSPTLISSMITLLKKSNAQLNKSFINTNIGVTQVGIYAPILFTIALEGLLYVLDEK